MRIERSLAVVSGVLFLLACAEGESSGGGGGKPSFGGSGNLGGSGATTSGGGTGAQTTGGTGATGGATGGGGVAGSGGVSGGGGTAATGGATGGGGSGGTGPTWPTCDTKPATAATKTIAEVWADNPSQETEVWLSSVFITAVSGSGCAAGYACQIFVQQDETYASLSAGAKHGIKIRVAASVANYFTTLKVGDKIDALGYAWRYTLGGSNELVLQVNSQLPGCAKKVGTGNPAPITGVQLSDFSVAAYETTQGPLLVQLTTVTGKPAAPTEIFGLWKTGVGIGDAGPENLVNASPFILPNNAFAGLPTNGTTAVSFQSITGVFAVYVPFTEAGTPPKYMVIYPRAMSEMVQ